MFGTCTWRISAVTLDEALSSLDKETSDCQIGAKSLLLNLCCFFKVARITASIAKDFFFCTSTGLPD